MQIPADDKNPVTTVTKEILPRQEPQGSPKSGQ
jgi:hypothetical protein